MRIALLIAALATVLAATAAEARAEKVFLTTEGGPEGGLVLRADLATGGSGIVAQGLGIPATGIAYDRDHELWVLHGGGSQLARVDVATGAFTNVLIPFPLLIGGFHGEHLYVDRETDVLYIGGGVGVYRVKEDPRTGVLYVASLLPIFSQLAFDVVGVVSEGDSLFVAGRFGELDKVNLATAQVVQLARYQGVEVRTMARAPGGDLLLVCTDTVMRIQPSDDPLLPPVQVGSYALTYPVEEIQNGVPVIVYVPILEAYGAAVDEGGNALILGDREMPLVYRMDLGTGAVEPRVTLHIVDAYHHARGVALDTPVQAFIEVCLEAGRIVVNGSRSSSRQGPIASHHWTFEKREPGTGTFHADGPVAPLSGLPWGRYRVSLEVTDESGHFATAAQDDILVPTAPAAR